MRLPPVLRQAMSSSRHPSWPRPAKLTEPRYPISPFLDLLPPPRADPPALPSRPPLQPPVGFASTSWAVPAAYPRSSPQSTGSFSRYSSPFSVHPPKANESKEERQERQREDALRARELRYGAKRWTLEEAQAANSHGLWLAVERWKREDKPDDQGLTLVMTHANGFLKEASSSTPWQASADQQDWHPTLRRLLSSDPPNASAEFGERSEGSSPLGLPTTKIDEIYMIDDIIHAASLDLNGGKLGAVHFWADRGRDVINFVQHLLPSLQASEQPSWSQDNVRGKVIGIGHSFGGNAMVQAASRRPDLFHALFLVDPMCPPLYVHEWPKHDDYPKWPLVTGAIKRRSHWPSREKAAEHALKAEFFKRYHPEVFEIWQSHALVDSPNGGVELATASWCEAAVFSEPTGLAEGWELLRKVEVPVAFLTAGETIATFGDKNTAEMVHRPPKSRNERIMRASHQVVQEAPDEVADALGRFIGSLSAASEEGVRARL